MKIKINIIPQNLSKILLINSVIYKNYQQTELQIIRSQTSFLLNPSGCISILLKFRACPLSTHQ